MSMWIELHTSLPHHPKTARFGREIDVPPVVAIGHLVSLWTWALQYAPDGNIGRFDAVEISIGAGWEGDPDRLLAALRAARFLEDDGALHDWHDYAGRLLERRQADAERKRAARSTPKGDVSAGRPADIQRTSDGHPDPGARTVPYPTNQPDQQASDLTLTKYLKKLRELAPRAFEGVTEAQVLEAGETFGYNPAAVGRILYEVVAAGRKPRTTNGLAFLVGCLRTARGDDDVKPVEPEPAVDHDEQTLEAFTTWARGRFPADLVDAVTRRTIGPTPLRVGLAELQRHAERVARREMGWSTPAPPEDEAVAAFASMLGESSHATDREEVEA